MRTKHSRNMVNADVPERVAMKVTVVWIPGQRRTAF